MKKILALLLVAVMILVGLAACGKGGDEKSKDESAQSLSAEDTTGEESTESEETSTDPYSHLRDFDLNGRDIKILVYGDFKDRYKSVEIIPQTSNPEVINTAIETRNQIVEDLLHCKITEVRVDDVLTDARTDAMVDGQYDIIMPYMTAAATLAQEGYLYNLYDYSDIIQLDKPYWDQRANEDLSLANKLYFSTGDFSLLTFDCTHAIVFNKKLVEQNAEVENPYELLKNDKWTLDALYRNAKKVTSNTDGEEGMTFYDTWGLFLNSGFTLSLFIGSGERLTKKDIDDLPSIAVDTERAVDVLDKIREIYNDATSTIIMESYYYELGSKYKDVFYAASVAFIENRALFRTLSIVDLNELLDYDTPYGILPTPKLDESQDEYYNIVSAICATCICIHTNVQNAEESAAFAEALAAASTDTLRKAYYENVLKGRKISDEDGEFALDIMFNNRVYEMASIYDFGSLPSIVGTCATASSNVFASTLDSIKPSVEVKINELIETIKNHN
ncbi:MAG: extracellular solute-binding protein [Clostridiales bacterium]|nr:extracellular solute-binding protein [Clostridiales bacterium]